MNYMVAQPVNSMDVAIGIVQSRYSKKAVAVVSNFRNCCCRNAYYNYYDTRNFITHCYRTLALRVFCCTAHFKIEVVIGDFRYFVMNIQGPQLMSNICLIIRSMCLNSIFVFHCQIVVL